MQATTFVNLVKRGIVKDYSILRINASGYPFITLMGKQGVTNLYFSKNASESVVDTFGEGSNITEFLRNSSVILTKNEAGEERYKLTSSSEYVSAADALGISTVDESDFDYEKFKSEFASQAVTV